MSCCTIVHDIEEKDDHILKYIEDYDINQDSDIKVKHDDLLIEILETFRKDTGFRITES
ncbi:MAG: hypothetical protein IID03_09605 [Candidatus Dadabacteria bacterium]|nr:hypothetical protein [Candidatus Dadabacteria bacterium]